MRQRNRTNTGSVTPWVLGIGVCGAVWGALGGSCAGPRSAPLSSQSADSPQSAATPTSREGQIGHLPELNPAVASHLDLLREAMNSSAVDLPSDGAGSSRGALATSTPPIDWSVPPTPVSGAPQQGTSTAHASSPPVLVMGADNTAAPPTTIVAPAAPPDPATRVADLTAELADATADWAHSEGSAVQALVRLAALETLMPGVSDAAFADGGLASAVSPEERTVLQAWRDVLRGVGTRGESGDSAGVLVDAASDLVTATEPWRDLRLQNTSLCTRVDGFGVYEALPRRDGRYTLAAGRTNRVIVYLELEHFQPTPMQQGGVEGFGVELTQSLALYFAGTPRVEADRDLIAWDRPEVQIKDFSRRARRDFFIVQMIELPSTLSVGSYRLKVRVTDRWGGGEAESVVDIDVVAEAALAEQGAPRRR